MAMTMLSHYRLHVLLSMVHTVAFTGGRVFRGVEIFDGRWVERAAYADLDDRLPMLRVRMTDDDLQRDYDYHDHALGYGLDA